MAWLSVPAIGCTSPPLPLTKTFWNTCDWRNRWKWRSQVSSWTILQSSLFPLFSEVQTLWEESEPTRCQAPYHHQKAQGHRFDFPCCWNIPPISTVSSSFLPSIQQADFGTCGCNVFCSSSHMHICKTSDQSTKHWKIQSHSYSCPWSYMRCDFEISVFDGQNCPFA